MIRWQGRTNIILVFYGISYQRTLGAAFGTCLWFCSLLFSKAIPRSDLPPHCSLKYTRKVTAHWHTAYSWNVPTRSKIRDNPCLRRRTLSLQKDTGSWMHTWKLLRFYILTQLLPHSHQSSVGPEGRQGWWSSFPLTQGAQVLQQMFSCCPESVTLLSEPPPQPMIVRWLHRPGPVTLTYTEQLPSDRIIPKKSGFNLEWQAHSCCVLPCATAVKPTWAWKKKKQLKLF